LEQMATKCCFSYICNACIDFCNLNSMWLTRRLQIHVTSVYSNMRVGGASVVIKQEGPVAHLTWCATGNMHTRSASDTCATGKPITRSAPHMCYGFFFTSDVLPAAHGICTTGSHITCATGKLFSSSVCSFSLSFYFSYIYIVAKQRSN
jgi:hypothetical protein